MITPEILIKLISDGETLTVDAMRPQSMYDR